MSRVLGHPIATIVIVFGVLMAGSSAAAQSSQPRPTSSDIQAQVQKSAELQRQALRILTDPERAERLIGNAYANLQSAMSAMVINASGQKSPDPLLKLNESRMRDALTQLQHASDTLRVVVRQRQEGTPPEYVDVVRNHIEQALRLTNGVFLL